MGFDAAHRVPGHENKCKHLHGHRYEVELTCEAAHLDNLGRVVDFGVMKNIVGQWIDDNLDHNVILFLNDPLVDILNSSSATTRSVFTMHAIPTAENIAELIFVTAGKLLQKCGVSVRNVRVWETPNCFADYYESDR